MSQLDRTRLQQCWTKGRACGMLLKKVGVARIKPVAETSIERIAHLLPHNKCTMLIKGICLETVSALDCAMCTVGIAGCRSIQCTYYIRWRKTPRLIMTIPEVLTYLETVGSGINFYQHFLFARRKLSNKKYWMDEWLIIIPDVSGCSGIPYLRPGIYLFFGNVYWAYKAERLIEVDIHYLFVHNQLKSDL